MTFAPYADLIWLETKTPDLEQARYFSRKIREKYPGKWVWVLEHDVTLTLTTTCFRWFVYNLSPSFNWSAHGFTGP